MNRPQTLNHIARRRRPRQATVNIRYADLVRHAQPNSTEPVKKHIDDWAMEWLYEDFTLWAQIKLHTQALAQMMRENEVLAQFNANSNRTQFTLGVTTDPLAYLVNLIQHHNQQPRK